MHREVWRFFCCFSLLISGIAFASCCLVLADSYDYGNPSIKRLEFCLYGDGSVLSLRAELLMIKLNRLQLCVSFNAMLMLHHDKKNTKT